MKDLTRSIDLVGLTPSDRYLARYDQCLCFKRVGVDINEAVSLAAHFNGVVKSIILHRLDKGFELHGEVF